MTADLPMSRLPPKPAACGHCGPCRRQETCPRVDRWERAEDDEVTKYLEDKADHDELMGRDLWQERSP